MKPFLFLGIRAQDLPADDEYAAVLRCAGLDERDVRRLRLERDELGPVDLDDWSGIIVGGGPWNVSDPEDAKPPEQRRGEARLRELALQVVDADFPFLGACYGIGTLGSLRRRPGRPDLLRADRRGRDRPDRRGRGRPADGRACRRRSRPSSATRRASPGCPTARSGSPSPRTCPVQAFRMGTNVYATQFHPELDVDGIITRIDAYRHFGYFEPDEGEEIKRQARASHVSEPPRILAGSWSCSRATDACTP